MCPNHTLDARAVFSQEVECITLNHTGFRRLANTAVWMLPTGCLTPWTSLQWLDISQHLPFLGANYHNKEVSSVALLVVAASLVPPSLAAQSTSCIGAVSLWRQRIPDNEGVVRGFFVHSAKEDAPVVGVDDLALAVEEVRTK